MERKAEADAGLSDKATGEPQHFCAVGLHWEIAQKARVDVRADGDAPTENGLEMTL